MAHTDDRIVLASPNVLVLLPLNDSQRATLEGAAPAAAFTYTDYEPTSNQVASADVIIGNLAPKRLGEAKRLRLLQLNSAGYDNYVAAGTLPEDAMLASASGAYGQAVSEHVLAMVLSMLKRLPAYRDSQRTHDWIDHGPVTTPKEAQVFVLGTGDIGGHFARLATALGAHVTGFRRHAGEPPAGFESVHTMDELPSLLGQADVVASFLPSTPATRGLVDRDFLAAMRPGSYLANGGRGDLVVTKDLVAALESGHLAGAALDVTSPEPLPADSPLWDAAGAFVTPHVSGGFHLPAVLDNICVIAAENLRRLAAGEEPRNLVRR